MKCDAVTELSQTPLRLDRHCVGQAFVSPVLSPPASKVRSKIMNNANFI